MWRNDEGERAILATRDFLHMRPVAHYLFDYLKSRLTLPTEEERAYPGITRKESMTAQRLSRMPEEKPKAYAVAEIPRAPAQTLILPRQLICDLPGELPSQIYVCS